MLKVYIAAPIQQRDAARFLMDELQEAGYHVTSRWLRVDDMPDTNAAARMDLEDIDAADAVVLLNTEAWRTGGTGGRHVEFGYALAKGKALFLVGVCTNVEPRLQQQPMGVEPGPHRPSDRTASGRRSGSGR